MANYLLRRAS